MNKLQISCIIFELRANDTITQEYISQIYKKKARIEHPDKHPNNIEIATQRFQKLGAAYEFLGQCIENNRIIVPNFVKPDFDTQSSLYTQSASVEKNQEKDQTKDQEKDQTKDQEKDQEDEVVRNIQKYSNPELQKMYETQCQQNKTIENINIFIRREFSDDVSKFSDRSINCIVQRNLMDWNEFMLKYSHTKKQKNYVKIHLIQVLWRNL